MFSSYMKLRRVICEGCSRIFNFVYHVTINISSKCGCIFFSFACSLFFFNLFLGQTRTLLNDSIKMKSSIIVNDNKLKKLKK